MLLLKKIFKRSFRPMQRTRTRRKGSKSRVLEGIGQSSLDLPLQRCARKVRIKMAKVMQQPRFRSRAIRARDQASRSMTSASLSSHRLREIWSDRNPWYGAFQPWQTQRKLRSQSSRLRKLMSQRQATRSKSQSQHQNQQKLSLQTIMLMGSGPVPFHLSQLLSSNHQQP